MERPERMGRDPGRREKWAVIDTLVAGCLVGGITVLVLDLIFVAVQLYPIVKAFPYVRMSTVLTFVGPSLISIFILAAIAITMIAVWAVRVSRW